MLWLILALQLVIPGSSHNNIGVCRVNDTLLTRCPADQARRHWLVLEMFLHPCLCLSGAGSAAAVVLEMA